MATRLVGLSLLSGSVLFIEIGLTRLFSTLYYPPFVFAVLSLAVLGIGLGAALATWRTGLRQPGRVPAYAALAALSALGIMSIPLAMRGWVVQGSLVSLVVLPYLFAGMALAALFSADATNSPRLYQADLVGAGVGAALVVPVLHRLGVINGLLLAATMLGVAGLFFEHKRSFSWKWLAPGIAIALLVSNMGNRWLDLDTARLPADKPIGARLRDGGQILHATWDAFARTELVDPANDQPYELYLDGAAGSVMPPAVGDEALWQDIGFFPFATEQPERVFVIGPGGGLDVWFGLQSGAHEIVAVEVNPASVALVREYAAYNGHLYDWPGLRILVDEGRSVLQREASDYDLIFLSQVVTLAAERDGYSLVENSTYTVEAFATYLEHLLENGQIALKLYDELTLTRALSTVLAAFRAQGKTDVDALRHVITLLDQNVEPAIPLLIVRGTPFSPDDSLSIGAVAREVGFTPLFLPGVWAEPPLDQVQAGTTTWEEVVADAEADISPTSDDRPFFFQFERGIPATLRWLLLALSILILVGGALLFGYQGQDRLPLRWFSLYFAALGLGFMLGEVAIIQQTRLYLGHPVYAITIVLATLLVAGGIGSGVAGRWDRPNRQAMSMSIWPMGGLLFCLLAWTVLWPWISQVTQSATLVWRVAVAIAALLPLAFFMGMPFPLGLRVAGEIGDRPVAAAWAINGIMSVVGSVLAVTVAILFGYSRVLMVAWAVYLIAGLVIWRLRDK